MRGDEVSTAPQQTSSPTMGSAYRKAAQKAATSIPASETTRSDKLSSINSGAASSGLASLNSTRSGSQGPSSTSQRRRMMRRRRRRRKMRRRSNYWCDTIARLKVRHNLQMMFEFQLQGLPTSDV